MTTEQRIATNILREQLSDQMCNIKDLKASLAQGDIERVEMRARRLQLNFGGIFTDINDLCYAMKEEN